MHWGKSRSPPASPAPQGWSHGDVSPKLPKEHHPQRPHRAWGGASARRQGRQVYRPVRPRGHQHCLGRSGPPTPTSSNLTGLEVELGFSMLSLKGALHNEKKLYGQQTREHAGGKATLQPHVLGHPHNETQRLLQLHHGSFCPFQAPRSEGKRAGPALGTTPSSFLPRCVQHGCTALGHISTQVKAEGTMHADPHIRVSPQVSSPPGCPHPQSH